MDLLNFRLEGGCWVYMSVRRSMENQCADDKGLPLILTSENCKLTNSEKGFAIQLWLYLNILFNVNVDSCQCFMFNVAFELPFWHEWDTLDW